MPDRLTSLDLTFLKAESPATPMHVGTVDIFEPPVHSGDGFDYERLVALIRDRIAFVPRYRQRVQQVPGRFAGPVWVDDEEFDITFHVRRSALPRPGTHAQLLELVARIMSRPAGPGPAAVGDVPGRGPARRPVRDHRQVPPGPCRRQQHGRHRPGRAGRDRAAPGHPDRHLGAPAPAVRAGAARRRVHRRHPAPDRGAGAGPGRDRQPDRGDVGPRGARGRGRLAGRAAPCAGELAAREDVRSAPVHHRADRPGGLPDRPGDARRHGQRRDPRGRRGRVPGLDDDPR